MMLTKLLRGGLAALLLMMSALPLVAQDDAASCLQAGRKSLKAAKGLEDEEKAEAIDQALRFFHEVGDRWPDALEERSASLMEIGQLLQRLGRTEEAMASYREILGLPARGSTLARALAAIAAMQRRSKDLNAATATLEDLIRRFPEETKEVAEARLDLAAMARDQGKWATAIRHAGDILEKHPDLWRQNVEACDLWLGVLVRCHQWEQARLEMKRLDALLIERFKSQKSWASVERGMQRMTARKSLTPLAVEDPA